MDLREFSGANRAVSQILPMPDCVPELRALRSKSGLHEDAFAGRFADAPAAPSSADDGDAFGAGGRRQGSIQSREGIPSAQCGLQIGGIVRTQPMRPRERHY